MADDSSSEILETNAFQLLRSECSQVPSTQLEQESRSLFTQLHALKDKLERLSSSLHLTKQQIDFFAQESDKALEGIKDCNWRFTKEICAEMGKIKSPSSTLLDITEKFLLLLDQRERSWKTFRAITHNYGPLKALMNSLNLDLVTEEQMNALLPVWKHKQSVLAKLDKVSKGGVVIAEWLCCCVEFRLKSETLRGARRKLPDLERKIRAQMQLIAEKNAQIFTCEDKLASAKATLEGRPSTPSDVSINSTSLSLILNEDAGIILSPRHEGTATRGLLAQVSPRAKPNLAFPSFGSPTLYNDRLQGVEFSIDYSTGDGTKGCCHSRFFCY